MNSSSKIAADAELWVIWQIYIKIVQLNM
jgi:hypothetical protein